MRHIHRFSAAIIIASVLFYLSACGSSQNNAAQNANTNQSAENGAYPASGPAPVQEQPSVQQLTLPEGTRIDVRLDNSISSERNRSGDTFQATLDRPIELGNGAAVVPQGSRVIGEVIAARPSGHLKTPAELSVALTALEVDGNQYPISTSSVSRRGQSHKKHDAKWIGGSAAGGALLGALIGHGKGAAIGALIGGGGGTAAAYATGKQNIVLPSEALLHFVLRQPVTISRAG
ncbi:MAG TPA: hypothetical protein VG028_15760 [Terriglobia bacterium]|nr:hypothetical protein [Terriglobia bacterium]